MNGRSEIYTVEQLMSREFTSTHLSRDELLGRTRASRSLLERHWNGLDDTERVLLQDEFERAVTKEDFDELDGKITDWARRAADDAA